MMSYPNIRPSCYPCEPQYFIPTMEKPSKTCVFGLLTRKMGLGGDHSFQNPHILVGVRGGVCILASCVFTF